MRVWKYKSLFPVTLSFTTNIRQLAHTIFTMKRSGSENGSSSCLLVMQIWRCHTRVGVQRRGEFLQTKAENMFENCRSVALLNAVRFKYFTTFRHKWIYKCWEAEVEKIAKFNSSIIWTLYLLLFSWGVWGGGGGELVWGDASFWYMWCYFLKCVDIFTSLCVDI